MVGLLVRGLEVVMSFDFFILAGFAFRGIGVAGTVHASGVRVLGSCP